MLGRVQRMDVSDGSNISYTYNNLNQVTGIKYRFNGTTKSSTYTYKKGGIPDITTYPNGASKTRELNGQAQVRPVYLTTTAQKVWETNCVYYTAIDDGVSYTTNLVGKYTFEDIGREISYTYDGSGNIATKTDTVNGVRLTTEYFYDELNQLIRENDPVANKTTTYVYDNGGNILEKREYDYTTGNLGTPTKTTEFYYTSTQWKDLLTSYDGSAITYDAIGNPLTFDGATLTWERGRKLSSMTFPNGVIASYKHNADGIRTQKTVGGVTTDFFLEGSTIVAQKTGNDVIWYYFDGDGTRDAIEYGGKVYYYMYNPQGDVIGLFDDYLNVVVEYTYDSWGKIIDVDDTSGVGLATANPFRYRGYYYDEESGLYYLNSRYYHPEIGRFINADDIDILGVQGDLYDKNLFAYCDNNPIMRADNGGEFWHIVAGAAVGGIIGGISSIVGQAISGQKINWAEVGVSAASGALTGAITAACPSMGAMATGIVHGIVGAGTHVATELVNGRRPTLAGTLSSGITSGILAGGTKAIGNLVNKGVKIKKIGRLESSNHANNPQIGVKYQINKPNGRPTIRSLEFHYNHSHNGYKPHWQQNSWNPWNNSVSSMKHWTWWGKRI